jgi:hypothetical protein
MKNKNRINKAIVFILWGLLIITSQAYAEDGFFMKQPIVPPPPPSPSSSTAGSQGASTPGQGQLDINELRKEVSQPAATELDTSPIERLMTGNPTKNDGEKETVAPADESNVQPSEENKNPHNIRQMKDNKAAKEEIQSFPVMHAEEGKENPEDIMDKIRNQNKAPQVVNDEGMQAVEVSLKDISRIVCFTDITRVIYSKEKVIEIKNEGKDAFIKNLPIEAVDPSSGKTTLKYDRRPKEVYLLCGTKTYSLILVPEDIPATTIYLRSSAGERESASKYERANDYDNTIFNLIKTVYREDIPNGYQVTDISTLAKTYQQADIVHTKDYTGDMLQVQEYLIFAKSPLNIDEIAILEQLKIKSPLAITVIDNILEANQQTRVIVVRFNNE